MTSPLFTYKIANVHMKSSSWPPTFFNAIRMAANFDTAQISAWNYLCYNPRRCLREDIKWAQSSNNVFFRSPGRPVPNTHRKTRPRGARLSHATSGAKKPARNSVEHMQRTNAKDDAVEGGEDGERPPSSQPIAPAVAGQAPPQPAGKSIAYSAALCAEEVVRRHFELYYENSTFLADAATIPASARGAFHPPRAEKSTDVTSRARASASRRERPCR